MFTNCDLLYKRCSQGTCQASADAPITTCPFGDDVVVSQITMYTANPLPSIQMTCEAADNYGQTTLNQFFCDDTNFKAACCQYCKSKHKFYQYYKLLYFFNMANLRRIRRGSL